MTWADLEPIVRTVPSAKASVVINADGRPRVNLSFSEPFYRELGEPKRCDIQAGTDEMLGKVRLVLNPEGKFEVREYAKGGAKIQIPLPDGLPARVREAEPCEIAMRERNAPTPKNPGGTLKVIIITLPIDAWKAQTEPRQVAAAPVVAKPNGNGLRSGKINAVEYLAAKGIKVQRLAGDWFSVRGERTPKSEVLKLVNNHREDADLSPITVDDLD